MKLKRIIAFLIFFFVIAFLFLGIRKFHRDSNYGVSPDIAITGKSNVGSAMPEEAKNQQNDVSTLSENQMFQPPLDRAGERVTKKPFGIFITPQNSPVQPERFSGYHTGTDFEIFPEEFNTDVPVRAICDGKILSKRTAGGYGGILVQSCSLENQPVTALYGHLKLESISKNVGDDLSAGEQIGILGKAFSSETNGERKHLHLGFRKGSATDIRGYVDSRAQLSEWLDPCSYVCQ